MGFWPAVKSGSPGAVPVESARFPIIMTPDEMTNSLSQGVEHVADDALLGELAELIVSSLNLEVAAGDINPDEPLYGEGLGLDSIDILEVALVVSKRYGLQLRSDHEDNTAIFSSLRTLADHIAAQRSP
jgi:acyl carrier protein